MPDAIATVFEFDKWVMTLEQTLYAPYMLKSDPEVRNGDLFPYWSKTVSASRSMAARR